MKELIQRLKWRTFFVLFLFSYTTGLNAQLKNTTWLGELKMPNPMECYYSFEVDTARLSMMETNEDYEVMLYRINKDTLFIKKIKGISPCSTESEGIYSFKINKDKLSIKPLEDDCGDRVFAFPDILKLCNKSQ